MLLRLPPDLTDVPLALAEARPQLRVGDEVRLALAPGVDEARARAAVEAGAFEVRSWGQEVTARAIHGLPDHVGPGMRLLCCGLNPSVHAADAGVGYVTPSNRFWRAAVEAGLTDRPRDPIHMLRHGRVGMTDIVKRPTPRAADLTVAEYRTGVERLGELCRWLRPGALVMVGLAGWRAAVDRSAVVGWQPSSATAAFGGTPVYVMPSTSGLNARVPTGELVAHLRDAASAEHSV